VSLHRFIQQADGVTQLPKIDIFFILIIGRFLKLINLKPVAKGSVFWGIAGKNNKPFNSLEQVLGTLLYPGHFGIKQAKS